MEAYGRVTIGTVALPWGRLWVAISDAGIRQVAWQGADAAPLPGDWAQRFAAYAAGQPFPAEAPVDWRGMPPFQRRVLAACRAVPFGTTTTYTALARALGAPKAARAVGQALARNPMPLVIPCHRVLGAGGQLTGFSGGLAWKRALLAHEGSDR